MSSFTWWVEPAQIDGTDVWVGGGDTADGEERIGLLIGVTTALLNEDQARVLWLALGETLDAIREGRSRAKLDTAMAKLAIARLKLHRAEERLAAVTSQQSSLVSGVSAADVRDGEGVARGYRPPSVISSCTCGEELL